MTDRPRLLAAAAAAAVVAACGGASTPGAASSGASPATSPALSVPTSLPGASTAAASSAAAPPHMMVIVMENREESSVIGQSDAPYTNSLANDDGLATDWFGVSHPSEPNYLAMISGSTHGVSDDGDHSLPGPTLVDQLAARGIGWRAYEEDMPSPCFSGDSSGGYARKHDPFMSFTSITGTPAQCARVVPHSRLAGDLASGSAPPFVFITPNLCHDGHDCGNPSADSWLRGEMNTVLGSSWYQQGGTVVITWDEGGSDNGCCSGAASGGQIPTIVVTAAGHRRRLTTAGDHYGMLRAIEEAYGVGYLGAAGDARNGDLRPLFAS